MAVVSQIPLPVPNDPFPWSTTCLSREHAGCNQDRLTGHAVLKWARDSQLSEFFWVVPLHVSLESEEIWELKEENK